MADVRTLLGKVVDYAERYDSEFLSSMGKVSQLAGRSRNFDSVASVGQAWLQDPVLVLASALWYGCARQSVPERCWCLATQVIKEAMNQECLYSGSYAQEVCGQFEHLGKHSADRFEVDNQWRKHVSLDGKRPMVRDLTCLHLNHKNLICNIRDWLISNAKQAHFVIRANVSGMGDKTTAFLLRDVAWVYGLEGQGSLIHTNQAAYIQPVDIWVRRLAQYLWSDLEDERDWKVIACRIVSECNQAGVSAIRFNQGVHYFDACSLKTVTSFVASA